MDQQQFKVSFPLATKLILSVVLLLLGVIIFLNVSAILLLKEDKRAYIYQSQQTGAVLSGREFVGAITRLTTFLRLSLANIDPTQAITDTQKNNFQSLIESQSDLIAASIYLLDINSLQSKLLGNALRTKEVKDLNFDQATYPGLTEDIAKQILPELKKNSYAFYNPSKVSGFPVLLVYFADVNAQNNPTGMPVAVGYFPLDKFVRSELGGLNLTIATKTGQVLFDTDPTVLYSRKTINDDPLFVTASASKLSSGATEYDFDGKRFIGSFIHPGWDLVVLNKIEWKKAIKATYELTIKFILLGVAAIGIAIIFTIFSSKKLTAPLNTLYRATKEVAQGNFNIKMEVGSKDEIGALTGSFNVMSEKIEELIQESMIKVKIENELAIASTVQERLIPNSTVQEGRVFIKSFYMSASQCGGDWWGYFIERNKLCLAIADATGHGFPSALITASARSCFSMVRKMVQENPHIELSPKRLVDYANRVIYESALGRIMMTFFVAIIDLDTLQMSYASAGHNPPWVFKKTGEGYTLTSLTAQGMRLGESEVMDNSEEKQVQLGPEDIFVMYTDGFTEGKNPEGVMYGKKKLRKVIEASLHGGAEAIVNNLIGDFFKHNDEKPLDDDLTFAAVTFNHQPS